VRLLAEAALKRHQSRNVVADVVSPIAEALSSSSMEGESRRTVTPTEVARRFGLERQGVLSRLKRGRTLHGEQDERGQWHVEISEVEAAYGRSWDDEALAVHRAIEAIPLPGAIISVNGLPTPTTVTKEGP
jgi:hypothetical protein